jgi:DNA modification methylase
MSSQFQLHHGDLFDVLKTLPADSVDACVTDPPYGIRFMGKAWDGADIIEKTKDRENYSTDESARAGENGGHRSIAAEAGKYNRSAEANRAFEEWSEDWAREVFRVLKPGAHIVSFASCRTYHRMASGVENAGFEIRDQLAWVFGSGFPKSHNLKGAHDGWGTALKPAWEPIVLARKPLAGTVAKNVEKFGTGAINIAGCRIESERPTGWAGAGAGGQTWNESNMGLGKDGVARPVDGRWPANLTHDGSTEVLVHFPESAGQCGDLTGEEIRTANIYGEFSGVSAHAKRGDSGSAARFFYCAKADSKDREYGLEDMVSDVTTDGRQKPIDNAYLRGKTERKNVHPTVKPTALMRWLCRLITPRGGGNTRPVHWEREHWQSGNPRAISVHRMRARSRLHRDRSRPDQRGNRAAIQSRIK